MFYSALVVDNYDETCSGIIEVYVPSIMTKQKKGVKEPENINTANKFEIQNTDVSISDVSIVSMNTIPAYPFSLNGKDHGMQLIPEIDDEVMIFFKDDNYSTAYYMYGSPYVKGKRLEYGDFLEQKEAATDPRRYIKHKIPLMTRNGNMILYDETPEVNGIVVRTSGNHKMKMATSDDFNGILINTEKGHQLLIDDINDGIVLKTSKGHSIFIDDEENGINIKTNGGHRLTLDDKTKVMQLVTTNGIGLEFDDNNNKLRIDSMDTEVTTKNDVKVEAQNKIDIESKTSINAKTTDVKVEAQAGVNISAKSNFEVDAKSNINMKAAQLEISVNGNAKIKSSGNCDVESTGMCKIKGQVVTVDGTQINLGEGATSSLLKGTEFLTLFNTHTHTAPLGPTTPPMIPLTPDILSMVTKTK